MGGGEAEQEGAVRASERQRSPRRGWGGGVQVRDSVRTVPGPVPVSRACAVCLRPRAGVRVFPGLRPEYPAWCVRVQCTVERVRVCACVSTRPPAHWRVRTLGLVFQRCIPWRECTPMNKRRIGTQAGEAVPFVVTQGPGILAWAVPFPPAGGGRVPVLSGVSQGLGHVTCDRGVCPPPRTGACSPGVG